MSEASNRELLEVILGRLNEIGAEVKSTKDEQYAIRKEIGAVEQRLQKEIGAVEQRLQKEIGAAEQRLRKELNEFRDESKSHHRRVMRHMDMVEGDLDETINRVERLEQPAQ